MVTPLLVTVDVVVVSELSVKDIFETVKLPVDVLSSAITSSVSPSLTVTVFPTVTVSVSFTKVKESQIENTSKETKPSFNKSEGITLESETNDKSDSGINIISFLIPIIGIIIYATQKQQYPIKAKAALDSAISGIVIGVIVGFISYAILLNQISSYNY